MPLTSNAQATYSNFLTQSLQCLVKPASPSSTVLDLLREHCASRHQSAARAHQVAVDKLLQSKKPRRTPKKRRLDNPSTRLFLNVLKTSQTLAADIATSSTSALVGIPLDEVAVAQTTELVSFGNRASSQSLQSESELCTSSSSVSFASTSTLSSTPQGSVAFNFSHFFCIHLLLQTMLFPTSWM